MPRKEKTLKLAMSKRAERQIQTLVSQGWTVTERRNKRNGYQLVRVARTGVKA